MRVLAHIHTFNDADIIDRTIEAVLRQTRPVDGILVVDNASTDGTLERPSLQTCHRPASPGESGDQRRGSSAAFASRSSSGYDWILGVRRRQRSGAGCAGEAARPLRRLAAKPARRDGLSRLPAFQCSGRRARSTEAYSRDTGLSRRTPGPEERYYRCHFVIWSGCLYRLAAVRQIGLPNPDYVLDWGEARIWVPRDEGRIQRLRSTRTPCSTTTFAAIRAIPQIEVKRRTGSAVTFLRSRSRSGATTGAVTDLFPALRSSAQGATG